MENPDNCRVHLRTTTPVKFRILCETLKDILIESNIHFTKEGMFIGAFTPTIFTSAVIHANKVDSYICKSEVMVGIDFKILFSCLKHFKQDDVLTIQITEEGYCNASSPEIAIFRTNVDTNISCKYTIKAMAIQEDSMQDITNKFDVVVCMPSSKFKDIVSSFPGHSEHLQIMAKCNDQESLMYIIGKGHMTKLEYKIGFAKDPNNVKGYEEVEEYKCFQKNSNKRDLYAIKCLQSVTKASNLSTNVQIYLYETERGFPLIIRYKIGTLGHVIFCIAPLTEQSDIGIENFETKNMLEFAFNEEKKEEEIDLVDSEALIGETRPPTKKRPRTETEEETTPKFDDHIKKKIKYN